MLTHPDSAAAQSAGTTRATSAHPGPVAAAALLAIDPGNTESAYAVINHTDRRPLAVAKVPNHQALGFIATMVRRHLVDLVAIEMVASYGMPVGAEVFETCVWIGRYQQTALDAHVRTQLVKRNPIKVHHCHDSKAKDGNISQALIDRFAPGQPNRGKGTKAAPGWFYGFAADMWQAYALGVYVADTTPISAAALPLPGADADQTSSTSTPEEETTRHPNTPDAQGEGKSTVTGCRVATSSGALF